MNPRPHALEQAFLDDIVAHPRDPTPALILADWLEDQADPRGELVRLSWSLRHEPAHAEFAARQERVQALLAAGVRPVVPRRTLAPGIEFAWLPPGSFAMGSHPDEPQRSSDERRHGVTLTQPFWMSVTPITQAQWHAVMGTTPSAFAPHGDRAAAVQTLKPGELARLPVENISWSDAQDFCVNLSQRTALPLRLPTEAQWEYACRAGTTSIYHFGNALNGTQACCAGKHPYGTRTPGPEPLHPVPVGGYAPNPWGLYDMHGNVWEWCLDWWSSDYLDEPEDPVGMPTGTSRACRGGSWDYVPSLCRSAYRSLNSPGTRKGSLGFRVCFTA